MNDTEKEGYNFANHILTSYPLTYLFLFYFFILLLGIIFSFLEQFILIYQTIWTQAGIWICAVFLLLLTLVYIHFFFF